jgi:predicted NUDIX family NTP pyrophosphohydrolase
VPTRRSAGLLVYRRTAARGIEVLCAHMGGPFWERKDEHAWSIPKGEFLDEADPVEEARREFVEEIGQAPPSGEWISLGEVRQSGGKRVVAFAVEGDLDVSEVRSNSFTMEWPPRSGRMQEFPEIDRAEWFDLDTARSKLVKGQVPLLDMLESKIGAA